MGETMVSGLPSMTAAHADLGLLHHGGAIHNAFRGGYPVLIMSGYPPTTREQRTSPVFWYQQRWDQGQVVRQYTKWDHKLASTDDAALVVSRALQIALEPAQGPSYLAVPAEVGRSHSRAAAGISAQKLGIARLGTGPEDAIRDIAGKLAQAEAPVIIIERAGKDPRTPALLRELARLVGATVKASRFRLNLSDEDSSLSVGTSISEADVILAIDCVVPWVPVKTELRPDVWIAAVGEDPAAREIPIYEFPADIRLTVDASSFIATLIEAIKLVMSGETRAAAEDRRRRQEQLRSRLAAPEAPSGPLKPRDVAEALNLVLEPEDLLVSEVFDTGPVRRTVAGTLFEKGGSSLGWAQAAAVGARIASGGKPTVAVTGDGAYMFGSPDSVLWLQQHHGAPVLTVILNNGGYRTGTVTLDSHYPSGAASQDAELRGGRLDPTLPFAAMAKAGGAFGVRVEERHELLAALTAAREATEQHGDPAVVEVMLESHADTVRARDTTGRIPNWTA